MEDADQREQAARGVVVERDLVFEQIEDRDRALVLDVRAAAHEALLVEIDARDAVAPLAHGVLAGRLLAALNLISIERACASSPSARASVTAAAPMRASARRSA